MNEKKRRDYQHQSRTAHGGQAWRKVRSKLPRRERKQLRLATDRIMQAAAQDAEAADNAGEALRSLKRPSFHELRYRREITLYEKVRLEHSGRITRIGRLRSRGSYDSSRSRAATRAMEQDSL